MNVCLANGCLEEAAGDIGFSAFCRAHIAEFGDRGRAARPPTCSTNFCKTPRPHGKPKCWICPECVALFARAHEVRRLLGRDPTLDPELALTYVIAPPSC